MDIGYNTILKYLCDDENNQSSFSTKKNIMVSSENFPEKFSNLFNECKEKFFRYGITRLNSKNTNISFLISILTLLDKKFISFDNDEEEKYINTFMEQLKLEVKKKSFKFELEYKFSKEVLIDRIMNNNFSDGILIQLIVQILDINILIFDFKNSNLYSTFSGDYLNPWKVTVMLGKEENEWEPIFSDVKKFSFNDNIIKNILTNEEIIYFNESFLNKYYSLLDNIDEIKDKNIDSENSNNDTFINPKNEIKDMNLNKTKLKNMKKDEILEIFDKLNLEVSNTLNKKDLIEKLITYI